MDSPFTVFLTTFPLRHFIADHELGDISVSLLTVQLPLCVRLPPYLIRDTEVVLLSALLGVEIAK